MIDFTTLRQIEADIRGDEGCRDKPYRDTEGHWTVGIGHNLDASGLCADAIEAQFEHDLNLTISALNRSIPWWVSQPDAIRRVLANLCFQLGIAGLLNFHKMLGALQEGHYIQAGKELMDSRLFEQCPARVSRLVSLINSVVESKARNPLTKEPS